MVDFQCFLYKNRGKGVGYIPTTNTAISKLRKLRKFKKAAHNITIQLILMENTIDFPIKPITVLPEDVILFIEEFTETKLVDILKQTNYILSCGVCVKRAQFLIEDIETTKCALKYLNSFLHKKKISNN